MPVNCNKQLPKIIAGYNYYFEELLWKADYPDPSGGASKVNWFDATLLAIGKSFAAYTSVLGKLPAKGGLAAPQKLDPAQITNAPKLEKALKTALKPLATWIAVMTAVVIEIDSVTSPCNDAYDSGSIMLRELQSELGDFSAPAGSGHDAVCAAALDWIKTFFYWQTTLAQWEALVYEHCVPKGDQPPSPGSVMRIEIPTGMSVPAITVIHVPLSGATPPGILAILQVPPPKWPPWPPALD